MSSETCPHCGAARPRVYDTGTQWACLSWAMNDGSEVQSKDCRIREIKMLRKQITTVTAERDDLQQRIDAAPVAWVAFNESGEVGTIAHGGIVTTAGNSSVERCSIVRTNNQPGG